MSVAPEADSDLRITLPPFPNGWFAVAHADSLAPGELREVHYLGRDLVLYRGEDGKPRVVDAYCAHLGAHLAEGGRVVGNAIECPFHSWKWCGDTGRCLEIPYAQKAPPKARQPVFETLECNGMVLIHHHTHGKASEWLPERIDDLDDPRFELVGTREWVIDSHPQEVMENGVDFAHFAMLHGWKCKELHWEPNGPYYSLKIEVDTGAEEQAATAGNITDADSFNSGPGFLFTRFRGAMTGYAINAMTPVEPQKLHIMHRYYAREDCDRELVKGFFDYYIRDYELDIPIWSNKIYRDRPVLAEGEKDFGRFRKWYRQFYS